MTPSHKILLLLLALGATVLAACDSSTATLQEPEHRLEINPDDLVAEVFTNYEFRTHVTNYPTSDLTFDWHIDSTKLSTHASATSISFADTGTHTVAVIAHSSFNDSEIAVGMVLVRAVRKPYKISLAPKVIDTTLPMKPGGGLDAYISFTAIPDPLPQNEFVYTWHIQGEDVDTTFVGYHELDYRFPWVGNYVVTVRATQGKFFYGADTANVRINFPPFSSDSVRLAKKISVYFFVDTSHPIVFEKNFADPLAIGMPFVNLGYGSFAWTGSQFFVRNQRDTSVDKLTVRLYRRDRDEVSGSFANDFKTLEALQVSVDDTSFVKMSPYLDSSRALYGFKLNNLQLVAMTKNEVVYTTGERSMNDFASDLYFTYFNQKYRPLGSPVYPIPIAFKAGTRPRSYAYVVFSR